VAEQPIRQQQPAQPWLALGVTLQLTATAEGGRQTALLLDQPFRYRPNWLLPGSNGAAGTAVLCASSDQLAPGGSARIVIIPLIEDSLPLWSEAAEGDELRMLEGAHTRGTATVAWTAPTMLPVPADDSTRFCTWAAGGQQWQQ